MEGNLSQGGLIPPGTSFGSFDLQGSMRVHHHSQHPHNIHPSQTLPRQGSAVRPSVHDGFPPTMGTMQKCDQTLSAAHLTKGERSKNSASDEDELSFTEEGADGNSEASRGMKGSPWQRVKWTDKMVRLLITAVSYIGEDAASHCGVGRRKFAVLQKKGKWKSVSKVMAERGYHVSPQQCEDKFNDLNKRYKRLNDILGRGTSCQVVENPALLDVMDLTEKEKDDVRKILSSKQLFYEEMCSYHNGNRLHLPHDPALQRSLKLALRSRDDHDNDGVGRQRLDDPYEDDQDTDDHDDFEENHASYGDNRGTYGVLGGSAKKLRQSQGHEDGAYEHPLNCHVSRSSYSHPHVAHVDENHVLSENVRAAWVQSQWVESRSLQLEERKLQIQVEMLELEKQKFKWERFSRKKDQELEKMKMENEKMKLENECIALELKQKEMGAL